MKTRVVNTIVCPNCQLELPPQVEACPACQAATRVPVVSARSEPARCEPALLDRPRFVLAFLFLASLFLGLPYLWKGRAFGTSGKVVVTVLVLLETFVLFWGFLFAMRWSWARITGVSG